MHIRAIGNNITLKLGLYIYVVIFSPGIYQYKWISSKEQNCMVEEKPWLFSCKDVELSGQAKVLEIFSYSVGVEHCKGIIDHVPSWDMDKGQ